MFSISVTLMSAVLVFMIYGLLRLCDHLEVKAKARDAKIKAMIAKMDEVA